MAQWEKAIKTFTTIENIRIKHTAYPDPMTLEALAKLEKRYNVIREKRNLFYATKWHNAFEAIEKAGGKAHCIVTHKYSGGGDPWWLWEISGSGHKKGIHFDWVKKPSNPINLVLGQTFYDVEQYAYKTIGPYNYKFKAILSRAIESYLYKNPPKDAGVTLKLTLNNRNYWYVSEYNGHGVAIWKKVAWYENPVIEVAANA